MLKKQKETMLKIAELGKKTKYESSYNPHLLFPIARQGKRNELGISDDLPFVGFDLWNHYEVSWLNEKGKPIVAIAEIIYPCESPFIIESKSKKLYFNSLNNTKFKNTAALQVLLEKDLSEKSGADVNVKITELNKIKEGKTYPGMGGVCLDDLDVICSVYTVDASFLVTESIFTEEILFSNLLKSNCLVTHQPDWASVQIAYKGEKINHEGLLKYLISFRNHNEFHEQCIERIFMDMMKQCQPQELSVYGRYTRRGGLDINVYRGTKNRDLVVSNQRLVRQ